MEETGRQRGKAPAGPSLANGLHLRGVLANQIIAKVLEFLHPLPRFTLRLKWTNVEASILGD
jgi:hypothetical protein